MATLQLLYEQAQHKRLLTLEHRHQPPVSDTSYLRWAFNSLSLSPHAIHPPQLNHPHLTTHLLSPYSLPSEPAFHHRFLPNGALLLTSHYFDSSVLCTANPGIVPLTPPFVLPGQAIVPPEMIGRCWDHAWSCGGYLEILNASGCNWLGQKVGPSYEGGWQAPVLMYAVRGYGMTWEGGEAVDADGGWIQEEDRVGKVGRCASADSTGEDIAVMDPAIVVAVAAKSDGVLEQRSQAQVHQIDVGHRQAKRLSGDRNGGSHSIWGKHLSGDGVRKDALRNTVSEELVREGALNEAFFSHASHLGDGSEGEADNLMLDSSLDQIKAES